MTCPTALCLIRSQSFWPVLFPREPSTASTNLFWCRSTATHIQQAFFLTWYSCVVRPVPLSPLGCDPFLVPSPVRHMPVPTSIQTHCSLPILDQLTSILSLPNKAVMLCVLFQYSPWSALELTDKKSSDFAKSRKLEFYWTFVAQSGMLTKTLGFGLWAFNKPKNLLFGMIDRFKRQPIDMLDFKRVKETLTHRIVITIAFATHAANQAVRLD